MSRARDLMKFVEEDKILPGTTSSKDPYPKIVRDGLNRMRPQGDKDLNWVWFHVASQQDKDEFEKYLVDSKDPLASEAGDPKYRYMIFMDKLVNRLQGAY